MKTYKDKKRTIKQKVLEKVVCNCCEKEIKPNEYENFYSSAYRGGYGSILGDMSVYAFDLCEPCLKNVFSSFKIDPYVFDEEGIIE